MAKQMCSEIGQWPTVILYSVMVVVNDKNLIVMIGMIPWRKQHKFTWTVFVINLSSQPFHYTFEIYPLKL